MNQLVAAGGEQDGRAVYEHRFLLPSQWYTTESRDQWFLALPRSTVVWKHTRDPYGVSMVALYFGPSSLPRSHAFQPGF